MTMSFSPCALRGDYLAPVFPAEVTSGELGWDEASDTPIPNPEYRPELDVNLSNRNAAFVLSVLGYDVDDSCFSAPISEFIGRGQQWLRQNLGKTSAEIEPSVRVAIDRAAFVECGLPAGYLNQTIHRCVVLAQQGRAAGATHITAV